MLIFYDVLLIDKDPVLTKPQRSRRKQLEQLIVPIPGRADLVMREEVYFSSPEGPKRLQQAFASGITQRWEGFVLKPCDEPYFTMMEQFSDNYAGCWIKLKKDYIQGLGDTADFAVVGAGYDGNTAKAAGMKNVSWTHFHIACLGNKEDVIRFDAKPVFKVVDAVNQCISKDDLKTLNQLGQFRAKPYSPRGHNDAFEIQSSPTLGKGMEVVFDQPFVFEVMGSGFDKLSNTDYFTLRFPRVLKIHWDRTFRDTVSLSEYEDMAYQARNIPIDASSQEDAAWIAKLERADKGKRGHPSWWEDSQTPSSSQHSSGPAHNDSQSQASKRRKIAPPTSLVRVDTQELLPGESRPQIGESSSRPVSQDSQATLMSLPTPPASSLEVAMETCLKASKFCDAGPSAGYSRKRNTDTSDGNEHGSNQKKPRTTAPESYKAAASALSSTKYAFSTAPLSEVTNPSLHRKASPPIRRIKKSVGSKNITNPQTLAEQQKPSIMSVPQTPSSTPTEQATSAGNDTPLQPPSSPPKPPISTDTTPPSTHPTPSTATTNTTSKPLDCSLTNAIVLLAPSISQMPYLTENLLSPYNVKVYIDPLRFVFFDSTLPPTPASGPDSASASTTPAPAAAHRPRTRKLVLVESHRPKESAWLVREFLRVDVLQDIEFFDWRVLEDVVGLREGGEKWKRKWQARFEGRVVWEEGVGGEVGRADVEWIYDNS